MSGNPASGNPADGCLATLFCFYFAPKIVSPGPRDFVRNRGWSLTVGSADDSAMHDIAVKLRLSHSSSARHVYNRQVGIVKRKSLATTQ
jgi:hypothetical protein